MLNNRISAELIYAYFIFPQVYAWGNFAIWIYFIKICLSA